MILIIIKSLFLEDDILSKKLARNKHEIMHFCFVKVQKQYRNSLLMTFTGLLKMMCCSIFHFSSNLCKFSFVSLKIHIRIKTPVYVILNCLHMPIFRQTQKGFLGGILLQL